MANIGIGNYGDFIRQAISMERKKAKTQISSDASVTEDGSAGVSFDNTLGEMGSEATVNTSLAKKICAPDRWTNASLFNIDHNTLEGYTVNDSALAKVKEWLNAEGIDADSRTPTHDISEEQIEWLSSRYDFNFLNACCFTHEEFGNFVLDLAYLNVFSLDEVKNMYGVMPFNANHKGYLRKLETDGGTAGFVNPFSGEGDLIEDEDLLAGLIMEYLKAKYTGLTEKEYERMTEEFAAQRRERLTVIEDFFAQVCNNKANNMGGVSRKVEDISEKLKEDFGGLI